MRLWFRFLWCKMLWKHATCLNKISYTNYCCDFVKELSVKIDVLPKLSFAVTFCHELGLTHSSVWDEVFQNHRNRHFQKYSTFFVNEVRKQQFESKNICVSWRSITLVSPSIRYWLYSQASRVDRALKAIRYQQTSLVKTLCRHYKLSVCYRQLVV